MRAGEYRFPPEGSIRVGGRVGRERITAFALDGPYPAGEVLRSEDLANRMTHRAAPAPAGGPNGFDPSRLLKRTIEVETR